MNGRIPSTMTRVPARGGARKGRPHSKEYSTITDSLTLGRAVRIRQIKITPSADGFLVGSHESIWSHVMRSSPFEMGCNRDGIPPAYVVPPVSAVPGESVLPAWKVCVELHGEPLAHFSRSAMYSSVIMVFFCAALTGMAELLAEHVTAMSDDAWARHAMEWSY